MDANTPPPSPDDPLAELLAEYLRQLDAGLAPDLEALRSRHPQLAAELDAFVAAGRRVDRLARPLQDLLRPANETVMFAANDTDAGPADGEPSAAGGPTAPRQLGGYEVLGEIARGGMGVVYRARQPGLDRLVAIKVIRSADLATPDHVERFVAEARSLARLQHPNIVHVYEVGTHDGQPYFALEYVGGGSLDRRTRGQPQPAADAVRLVEVLARAVQHAHERGIIHRDLKPANVLLAPSAHGDAGHTAYGLPKLTDFGLARGGDHRHTADGAVLGTPSYMAPEQAAGESARVGPATDVYALGAILYELLTGRPPFQGGSVLATLEQVRSRAPVPPARLRPDLPAPLEAVVLCCLAKRPEERYSSAAALADALHGLSECQPTVDYRPADHPSGRRGWRRWVGRVAVGLLALGLLVGAALALWPRGEVREPEARRDPTPRPAAAAQPLRGVLDVRVWGPGDPLRRGLRLHQERALPLRAGDLMRVEVEMNRPAYLYVVWLGADGTATPLYPWRAHRWDDLPPPAKRERLYLPEDTEKDAAPLSPGPSGVETLVLLARDEPLPAGADVAGLFAGLPRPSPEVTQVRAAWFENGRLVQNEADRGPLALAGARVLDDPVLRLQQVLGRQVPRLFAYSRAVSFAFQGK